MIKKKKKTTVGSVALKAGVWYVVSSILVKAISIITTPIFTRMMTTLEYGMVATFTSWYSLLLTFCTMNLTYSIGRAKLDFPNKLDDYIGAIQLLSAFVTAAITMAMIIFIQPVSNALELSNILIVLLALYLFFSPTISFIQNGYRYRYQYKQNIAIVWYIALSTVVLSLILIFFIPGNKALLRIIGIVIPTVILSIFYWIKTLTDSTVKINVIYWKYGLVLSGPLVLHTISLNILSQSDRIFITKICGADITGIYSLAHNYGAMLSIVTSAISEGWLPWFHDCYFNQKYDEIKINVKYVVTLCCYAGLACIAFAPEAITVLGGARYAEGVVCVSPIVLGIVCQYIYTHYVNIEMHLKKVKYVSVGTIFAALLNILLNTIFIPIFGYIAASYTTFASYTALLIVHFLITRRILKVKLYNDFFMFSSIVLTTFVSILLVCSYNNTVLRYSLIGVGFFSFLMISRQHIRYAKLIV